jgi:hypothetical protein
MQRTARWVSLAVLAVLVVAIVVGMLPDGDSEIRDHRVGTAFAKECKEFRQRMGSLAYDGTAANQVAAACAKRGY